ncbi:DUF2971 domain-containing protein [Pseudomonas sp. BJa3]|uniref:DUF2971 domain-containing protein n=1 Tax=Pseudomonas sp. BJa3 TaxID=2986525 RepID=UPI002265EB96|nr:DUF2971 domain-containing protein [Pseudomonas sp. BJa3]MCX5508223.1 DUF2971 domain-containing protein [Pseudomonas sp. BJa3]
MEESKKLYKYMGPDIADRFLLADHKCTLKLSYLKDYNDPFEFFLTIDYNQEPEILAYYKEIIAMVTHQPVTCFSKSPLITPLWAHYASNSQGFVAEIDEAALNEWLESQESESSFGDIDYQDTPHDGMQDMLLRAYVVSKPRHVGWLWQAIGSAAYFTKQTCWGYEQERRLIADEKTAVKINEHLTLLHFPASCVTSIIVGAKASTETKAKLKEVATSIGCKYFEKHIGRSSTTPFLLDSENNTHIFNGNEITSTQDRCMHCKEPTHSESEACAWCMIDDNDVKNAANRNTFRMLNNAGILENYLDNFIQIGKNFRK